MSAVLTAVIAYVYEHRAAFVAFALGLAFHLLTKQYALIPADVLTLLVALGLVSQPATNAVKYAFRR